jgi:small multidrug resistance pump
MTGVIGSARVWRREAKGRRRHMGSSWMFLAGAIVSDVVGTYALERSEGLRRRWPAAASVVAYIVALASFSIAIDGIAISVADATFAAGGTALVTMVGIAFLGERLNARKALGLGLVVLGVVVLRLQES